MPRDADMISHSQIDSKMMKLKVMMIELIAFYISITVTVFRKQRWQWHWLLYHGAILAQYGDRGPSSTDEYGVYGLTAEKPQSLYIYKKRQTNKLALTLPLLPIVERNLSRKKRVQVSIFGFRRFGNVRLVGNSDCQRRNMAISISFRDQAE